MYPVEHWFAPVWLVRGALVYFSPGLTLKANEKSGELELADQAGATFPLSPTGAIVCAACRRPIAVERLVEAVACRFAADDRGKIDLEIRRFLGDLFLRGLIGVHQSFARELASVIRNFPHLVLAAWIDRGLVRRGGRFPVRRYLPSSRNVLRANLEAHQSLLALGASCAILLPLLFGSVSSLNRYAGSGLLQVSWAIAVFFAAILLVSILHEFGHWYAARHLGVRCRWVTARRGLVNLAFLPTDERKTLAIAVAGPLSGVVGGMLLMTALWLVPPGWMILVGMDQLWLSLSLAIMVVTVMQAVSLTPLTSDGRMIWRLFRARRKAADA